MNNTQQSEISLDVINAYRETEYFVNSDPPITLHVNQKNDALVGLHKKYRVESSAFITAYNPFSQATLESENLQLQNELSKVLETRSLTYINGKGIHPSNTWPAEHSFLILGLSLEASKILGLRFHQNAILWINKPGIPQLILLR